ncbi:hypothetical protein [Pseudomonas rhodesiae]|uniref:hypothetical protein n=1 Tax=Pseudomonas rhodesiae TaxID=76760 RepID=UPI002B1DB0AF|nr:hypothetical protein [Pseudomonas rhodesiae]
MSWEDIFKTLSAVLVSVGGAGALILSLSSFFGKHWANRLILKETHDLAKKLEAAKRDFDVMKENTLRFQNDKIIIYRMVIEMVAKLLASLDSHSYGRLQMDGGARFDEFNEQRLKVYGHLAMLAPQSVMDAQDNLIDHLLKITQGSVLYEWSEVRSLALDLLNTVREDIGIGTEKIAYNGKL